MDQLACKKASLAAGKTEHAPIAATAESNHDTDYPEFG